MRYIILIFISVLGASCTKEWLDVKPNKKLVIPSTVADFQAVVDNIYYVTGDQFGLQEFAEVGADNYFLDYNVWQSFANSAINYEYNAYIFSTRIFNEDEDVRVWNMPYTRVLYTNIALDGLKNLKESENGFAVAKGNALFARAHTFYWLQQIFGAPYKKESAGADLGIRLKLTSLVDENPPRSPVAKCYDQIIQDLLLAEKLLPPESTYPNRATRMAVDALLARIYLGMGDYANALKYSGLCIQQRSSLMDFNDLNPSATYPIPALNQEVLYMNPGATSVLQPSRARVDTALYLLYDDDDLRKSIFFKPVNGTHYFAFYGSYEGGPNVSGGINLDEIFLIKAEAETRLGNFESGLQTLNQLLVKRWRTGTFIPFAVANQEEALDLILIERRKELCFRGLRWSDLRRLNQEERYKTVVKRVFNGTEYLLEPNSPKYTYPIPPKVIQFSGVEQNVR